MRQMFNNRANLFAPRASEILKLDNILEAKNKAVARDSKAKQLNPTIPNLSLIPRHLYPNEYVPKAESDDESLSSDDSIIPEENVRARSTQRYKSPV